MVDGVITRGKRGEQAYHFRNTGDESYSFIDIGRYIETQ